MYQAAGVDSLRVAAIQRRGRRARHFRQKNTDVYTVRNCVISDTDPCRKQWNLNTLPAVVDEGRLFRVVFDTNGSLILHFRYVTSMISDIASKVA